MCVCVCVCFHPLAVEVCVCVRKILTFLRRVAMLVEGSAVRRRSFVAEQQGYMLPAGQRSGLLRFIR